MSAEQRLLIDHNWERSLLTSQHDYIPERAACSTLSINFRSNHITKTLNIRLTQDQSGHTAASLNDFELNRERNHADTTTNSIIMCFFSSA